MGLLWKEILAEILYLVEILYYYHKDSKLSHGVDVLRQPRQNKMGKKECLGLNPENFQFKSV